MNKLSQKKGFTLVELMVVISIIAILSIIGTVVYSTVQIRSRDNKRVNDLKTMEAALEQYYADQNNFPLTSAVVPGSPLVGAGSNAKTYLNPIPQDPLGTSTYVYQSYNSNSPGSGPFLTCDNSAAVCNVFCLSAKVEGSLNSSATTIANCPASGYNYQVDSLNPNNNIKYN